MLNRVRIGANAFKSFWLSHLRRLRKLLGRFPRRFHIRKLVKRGKGLPIRLTNRVVANFWDTMMKVSPPGVVPGIAVVRY